MATKDAAERKEGRKKGSKDMEENGPSGGGVGRGGGLKSSADAGWNLKIGEIMSSLSTSVTLPRESRATGEADFAQLRAAVSPLRRDAPPVSLFERLNR